MARSEVTKTPRPGSYNFNYKELTMESADVINGNKFRSTGNDLVIAFNDDNSSHEITITSTEDRYGRIETFSQSIGGYQFYIVGPLDIHGFIQSDGFIYIEADSTNIKFGIVEL